MDKVKKVYVDSRFKTGDSTSNTDFKQIGRAHV